MLAPEDTSLVPQGGRWHYREPSNGVEISSNHIRSFLSQAFAMREANGLFTGTGWEAEVLDLMCQQHQEFRCLDVGAPERYLSLDDIRRFGTTLAKWIAEGGTWESIEEAERRASICITCPHNKVVNGCWGCHGIMNWLMDMLGSRSTSKDDQLQSCDICLCAMRAKVHLPLSVISNEGITNWPAWCWQNEANQQGH